MVPKDISFGVLSLSLFLFLPLCFSLFFSFSLILSRTVSLTHNAWFIAGRRTVCLPPEGLTKVCLQRL